MKKPFKVGERVRVYDTQAGRLCHWDGEVKETAHGEGALAVEDNNGVMLAAHPKQCRRLGTKPKVEKRERVKSVWLFDGMSGGDGDSVRDLPLENPPSPNGVAAFRQRPCNALYSEFVRLEHGHRLLSREDVVKVHAKLYGCMMTNAVSDRILSDLGWAE